MEQDNDKKIEDKEVTAAATEEVLVSEEENVVDEVEVSEAVDGEEAEHRKLAKGDSPEFKWYVAHAMSGYENRVAKTLKERIITMNLTEYFADIMVPEEEVVSNAGGKKRKIKKKFFPGYVLVKMIMSEKTWHFVMSTDKITGFIGGTKGYPTPISDEEAAQLTNQAVEGFQRPKSNFDYSEGESVKVIEGPFASFVGTIEHVSEKGKIRVQVSIFGRPTPVELDHTQIEKV